MGVLFSSLHGCSSRVLHLIHWNRKGNVSVDITFSLTSTSIFYPTLDRIFIYGEDLGRSALGIHPYDFVVRKKIDFPFPAPMWKFPEKGFAGPCGPHVYMWTRGSGCYDWPNLSPGWGWVHLLPEKPWGWEGHQEKSLWIGSTTMGDLTKLFAMHYFLATSTPLWNKADYQYTYQ